MSVRSTLSGTQWTRLQAAFEEAMSVPNERREELLRALYREDEQVADALAGMLGAAERWRGRTGEARANLVHNARPIESLQPGDTLGLYRIVGEIGRGGMGRVYLAERNDGRMQQRAAIKIVRPGEIDDFARNRFRLERELLAGFNHPNIARLFDAGESAGGEPYFVMEYVRGQTLTQYCDERKLTVHERLALFLDVCDAVRYAHSMLVLHRDIKPGNILVDEHGVPKLIDFGIAKPLPSLDADDAQATATQRRVFSPLNAAPEQLRSERAGLACDVYQLGTVLYELLCGETIFDLQGKTPAQVEECILQRTPVAPSVRIATAQNATAIQQARGVESAVLMRQLRGDLDEIVLHALRKEPERRYASVEQLADDIRRHLDDLPVRARGTQRGYRAQRFAKRHWRALVVAAIGAAMVVGFVATVLLQTQRVAEQRDRAVSEQHRSDEVTQFLIDVFKAADPTVSLSRDTPIGTVVDRGRTKLQGDLRDSPTIRSRILLALAEVYASIDDLTSSRALAAEALSEYEQSGRVDARELIIYLEGAWSVYSAQSTQKQAAEVIDRAVALHDALGDSLLESWKSRVHRLQSRFDLDERATCTEMSQLVEQLRNDPTTQGEPFATAAIITSACFGQADNDPEKAIALVREGVIGLSKVYSADNPMLWSAKSRLGQLLSQARRPLEALPIYEDVGERREKLFGPESLAFAQNLVSRGVLYSDLERYGESEAAYLRALSIFERLYGDNPHPNVAATLINLAEIYDNGSKPGEFDERARKADLTYARAMDIAARVFGEESTNLAGVRSEYADFKRTHGDLPAAKKLIAQIMAVLPITYNDGLAARLSLARIRIIEGDRDEAQKLIEECEAAVAANPKKPKHLLDRVIEVRTELTAAGTGKT